MNDNNKIICPNCGREYLPGEIFLPKQFLGQPNDIERDIEGNILWSDGVLQCLEETYCCDKCLKPLNIKANITYSVTIDSKKDFSTEYTTNLYKERIYLNED